MLPAAVTLLPPADLPEASANSGCFCPSSLVGRAPCPAASGLTSCSLTCPLPWAWGTAENTATSCCLASRRSSNSSIALWRLDCRGVLSSQQQYKLTRISVNDLLSYHHAYKSSYVVMCLWLASHILSVPPQPHPPPVPAFLSPSSASHTLSPPAHGQTADSALHAAAPACTHREQQIANQHIDCC